MQKKELQTVRQQGIVQISKEKLLKVYNPENCIVYAHKLKTVTDAIDANTPTIGRIMGEQGEVFTQSFLMLWLVYLNEILNLKKPMTQGQIALCATQLLQDYSSLKVSELTYIFRRIITGEYGEFYESLSIAKVVGFIRNYWDERIEVVVEQREREHAEFRYGEGRNESESDAYKRKLKKIWR